jgi:hypothetical protein
MDEYEIKNATIENIRIHMERGFIVTISITLDYGGAGQSFGGYMLAHKDRGPTPHLAAWVLGLMEVFKVDDIMKLKGKPCRAEASHCKVKRIGHFTDDRWFDPEEVNQGLVDPNN